MIMHLRKPDFPLSEFVDSYWYMEHHIPISQEELSLPDGSVDLIIDLTSAKKVPMGTASGEVLQLDPIFVCGPHSKHFVVCPTPETKVVGVRFKPGGAYSFLGCPMHELLNVMIPMDTIWGRFAEDLREELADMPTVGAIFQTLTWRLLQLGHNRLHIHPAVQFAVDYLNTVEHPESIERLVDRIGISQRRFIELFKRETGYAPKGYSRIRRFQGALRTLSTRQDDIDWLEIALNSGYYDQAHFIKDFRAFSGLSPSEYEGIPGRHYNHARL